MHFFIAVVAPVMVSSSQRITIQLVSTHPGRIFLAGWQARSLIEVILE